MSTRKSPSRRSAVFLLIVSAILLAAPASARRKPKVDDASPAGLAALVSRIHENALRIDRISFLFEAPGYPRHDPLRAALLRENEDLFLRVEHAAQRSLDPIRKEPLPGQFPWWQLLRDTENGAHEARLQGWWDFRDPSVLRRYRDLANPRPAEEKR